MSSLNAPDITGTQGPCMKLQEFIVILLLFLESSESNSLGYCR
jgi:hypothetical protein